MNFGQTPNSPVTVLPPVSPEERELGWEQLKAEKNKSAPKTAGKKDEPKAVAPVKSEDDVLVSLSPGDATLGAGVIVGTAAQGLLVLASLQSLAIAPLSIALVASLAMSRVASRSKAGKAQFWHQVGSSVLASQVLVLLLFWGFNHFRTSQPTQPQPQATEQIPQ